MAEREQSDNLSSRAIRQASRGFWIYVWLGVSGLLNLSGMASLVDGFVTWANFFRNIIDVYRATIREPLAWIGHQIWPFGPIPGWVFDVVVFWAALLLAVNIWLYIEDGKTVFGWMRECSREFEDKVFFLLLAILGFVSLPFFGIFWAFEDDDDGRFVKGVFLNFLLLVAAFMLILFINWQIRQHGG